MAHPQTFPHSLALPRLGLCSGPTPVATIDGVVAGTLCGRVEARVQTDTLTLELLVDDRQAAQTQIDFQQHECVTDAMGTRTACFGFDLERFGQLCDRELAVALTDATGTHVLAHWRSCAHAHAMAIGSSRALQALFFAQYYRHRHGLESLSNDASFSHFLHQGIAQGFDPCPWFSGRYFRDHHGDLLRPCEPPVVAYLRHQRSRDVQPSALFDPAHYAAVYTDISDGDLLAHFVGYGHTEGRHPVRRQVPSPVIEAIDEMSLVEPAISSIRTDPRSVVRYGFPTAVNYVPHLVRKRFGQTVEAIVCLQHDANRHTLSAAGLNGYLSRHGIRRALEIVVEGNAPRPDASPACGSTRVDTLYLDDESGFPRRIDKIETLHNIIGLLAPRRVLNVDVPLVWELFDEFGPQLASAARLDGCIPADPVAGFTDDAHVSPTRETLAQLTEIHVTQQTLLGGLRATPESTTTSQDRQIAGTDSASGASCLPTVHRLTQVLPHLRTTDTTMAPDGSNTSHTRQRICLVTEELPGFGPSGGIGAAIEELAVLLARSKHEVTILYCGPLGSDGQLPVSGVAFFDNLGVSVIALAPSVYTNVQHDLRANAYAVWRHLLELDGEFDVVHFHDYKGLAFYVCEGKRQGLGLGNSEIVVQLHGPTRWTIEANRRFFSVDSQLIADHLERRSVELADRRVSPSAYLADWARTNWQLPEHCPIEVIPNLCGLLEHRLRRIQHTSGTPQGAGKQVKHLVIFGRHEARKGIDVACAALSRLNDLLAERRITVHFVGQQGVINGQPSGLYFNKVASTWKFAYTFNFGLDRFKAGEYVSRLDDVLVVVPAPIENSPYAVLEPLMLGLPVISSDAGGGHELVAAASRGEFCCQMDADGLEATIRNRLAAPQLDCQPAFAAQDIENRWLDFHRQLASCARTDSPSSVEFVPGSPLVTIGITHFERPHKLADAVISMLKQDYQNIEIIVIDDGSANEPAVEALDELAIFLDRAGVRLLREPNRYLGAARNRILEVAQGDYIIFLDDDDIALPNLVSTLLGAALRTDSTVVSCFSHYMSEELRSQVLAGDALPDIVDYFPCAGPLALATEQNVFGTATSIIRLVDLRAIGGYTELRNVGNEDYELYIRLAQAGLPMAVCPLPLFLYEVGRPSMLSMSSTDASFRRCFDALRFDENSPAWQDYANLNIGRQLGPQSANRLQWLNSFQKDSDERNRLSHSSTEPREYVEIAAAIAERTGNMALALAFRHAFDVADKLERNAANSHVEDPGEPIMPVEFVEPISARDRFTLPKPLREARHAIAVGDMGTAIDSLTSYLASTHSLDKRVLIPLHELAEAPSSQACSVRLGQLIDQIHAKRYRGSLDEILLATLRISHRHDLVSLRARIAKRILNRDQQEYRKRYADIREAEKRGRLDGFDHYIRAGRREGRVGFEMVSSALTLISNLEKVSYVLEDFHVLIQDPDQGAAEHREAA